MNAAAHTWRRLRRWYLLACWRARLRRWYLLACWRARLRQLDELMQQLASQIADDSSLLDKLQVEHRVLRNRIAHATRPPAPPAPPLTWGL